MVSRRPTVRQRKRIFLGCEGESEVGYAALLARLVEQRHQNVHLDPVPLGAGSPLAMVKNAGALHNRRRLARGEYVYRAILFDADTLSQARQNDDEVRRLAKKWGFDLILQDPCHEAFLLLHLADGAASRPQTTADASRALKRLWPTYEKALPAVRLGHRIDRTAVLRACAVHEGLRRLLEEIDFGDEA
jgi:hypothetical protein